MSAHDRYLADYHTSLETVYCQNTSCANSEDGVTVRYESEYGQGSITPEDCPICNGELSFDRPDPPDDDEDAL